MPDEVPPVAPLSQRPALAPNVRGTDNAGEQFEVAQRYVVDRVKERPVTATLAGIGVGLLIGLLLAGRGDRR